MNPLLEALPKPLLWPVWKAAFEQWRSGEITKEQCRKKCSSPGISVGMSDDVMLVRIARNVQRSHWFGMNSRTLDLWANDDATRTMLEAAGLMDA